MKAALYSLSLLLGMAFATQASANNGVKACEADVARYCPNVAPGEGRQIQCLKTHMEEVSPACKKELVKAKVKMDEQKAKQQQGY